MHNLNSRLKVVFMIVKPKDYTMAMEAVNTISKNGYLTL
jgi:hypothetical protein